ncbi:MAG: retropepsin-like aspartic protease family protein [bacterium]
MAAPCAVFGADITANGLFSGKAVLTINGQQRLMRVGETSPEGVTLVSSSSKEAIVRYQGEDLSLTLSRKISAKFTEAKVTEVRLPVGPGGHYYAGGSINGRSVTFVVDTGATVISMNQREADRLGIDIDKGQPGQASTAGGLVRAHFVTVPQVTVGSISVPRVMVAVLEGGFPEQILLGNSFLSRVEMREEGGVLVLRRNR